MANDTASEALTGRVALITGAARRLGAATARGLHAAGMNVIIHYHSAQTEARVLADELNDQRSNSALTLGANLLEYEALAKLIDNASRHWGQLDALINNASAFYATPISHATPQQWDELMGSNLHAPYFLSAAAAPHLRKTQGCIINLLDSNLERPMNEHSIYLAAKAGLASLTRTLALELAPDVRVNAVAPGAILWPEATPERPALNDAEKQQVVNSVPLHRQGTPKDIAQAITYLLDAPYVNGHVLTVDGGRAL